MIQVGDILAPDLPSSLRDTGIEPEVLVDLTLKLAYTVPNLTTIQAIQKLGLPLPIISEVLGQLVADSLVEILGQAGPFDYRFSITDRGRDRARRLMEISGYVGPAPVSIEAYAAVLDWQLARFPKPSPANVADCLCEVVLPEEVVEVIALAISSRRTLLLYGPPGNGKTTVAFLASKSLERHLWIPHCIGIDNRIIQVFDPRIHKRKSLIVTDEEARRIDRRWVLIDQPFVVVGGDMTLDDLDLAYDSARRYYEAPLHFKANGGMFLLDDFGTQPVEPHRLLNRWTIPLEQHVDYWTLHTGEKVQVPFQQMLIISTNLDVNNVMTPALLRRMGYRVYLDDPSPQNYAEIFRRYAARYGLTAPPHLVQRLIERYMDEGRPLSGCGPRDLIERVRDICQFRDRPLVLNDEVLDLAWKGYFSDHIAVHASGINLGCLPHRPTPANQSP